MEQLDGISHNELRMLGNSVWSINIFILVSHISTISHP